MKHYVLYINNSAVKEGVYNDFNEASLHFEDLFLAELRRFGEIKHSEESLKNCEIYCREDDTTETADLSGAYAIFQG